MFAHTSSPFLLSTSSEYFCPNSSSSTKNFLFLNPIPSNTTPSTVRFRKPTISAACTYSSAETTAAAPPPVFMASSSSSSLYEILGISMGASGHEIKAAYRKLARVCHPDVVAIERKDNSVDDFIKIHFAYSTLSDPQKRADYDRKLFIRRKKPFNSSSSFTCSSSKQSTMSSSYTRRNWETDQCW